MPGNEVIDPELYYQLWKQEHGERVRTASRRQAISEVPLTRVAARSWEVKGSASTYKNWLTVISDGVFRLRRLWRIS
jgi:hypothetical protein